MFIHEIDFRIRMLLDNIQLSLLYVIAASSHMYVTCDRFILRSYYLFFCIDLQPLCPQIEISFHLCRLRYMYSDTVVIDEVYSEETLSPTRFVIKDVYNG